LPDKTLFEFKMGLRTKKEVTIREKIYHISVLPEQLHRPNSSEELRCRILVSAKLWLQL